MLHAALAPFCYPATRPWSWSSVARTGARHSTSYLRILCLSMNPRRCRSLAVSCTAARIRLLALRLVVMANLLQCSVRNGRVQLRRGSRQQVGGEVLQRFELLVADVRALVLLEPENEKPSAPPAGRHECSRPAALAPTRKRNPLLDDAATQLGIDQ